MEISFDRSKHVFYSEAFAEIIKDTIRFFNGTPVYRLPLHESFIGTGVYALYYTGRLSLYKPLYEMNRLEFSQPIYVGKAVPRGWRQGRLQESGIRHRALIEWNKDACETLRKNFDESSVYEGDVREFDFLSYSGVDIIAGGPPCQPFSLGGKANGYYKGLKYAVTYKLVNAADYGVPQKRERVIIVGFRSDLNVKWAFPLPTHSEDALLWSQFVTGEYWRKHKIACTYSNTKVLKEKRSLTEKYGLWAPELLPWVTIRDVTSDLTCDDSRVSKAYPGHTGSFIDEPSKTIKAGVHGVPGGEYMVRLSDGNVRYFTVEEAKRIQSFPDDYSITGSWTESMRQLGNAVPVQLAYVVGKSIVDALI